MRLDILIVPAEDLANVWVACCPYLALCTQGDSPDHAKAMMAEAIALVTADDAADGIDPRDRERPDSPFWSQIRAELALRRRTNGAGVHQVDWPLPH